MDNQRDTNSSGSDSREPEQGNSREPQKGNSLEPQKGNSREPQKGNSREPAGDAERFASALEKVREGNDDAIAVLWNDYFQRLVRLAAKRLPANLKRTGDEEDIALSAFNSFIAGIRRDQFPDLSGPDNLWGLLITLTGRKVNAHLRHQTRQKRGGGAVRGESVFMDPEDARKTAGIGGISGGQMTADLDVELEEACNQLLDQLPDPQLRQIAVMRMDGFLVDEIADRLGISKRATERRLQLIRKTWTEAVASDDSDKNDNDKNDSDNDASKG